MCPALRCKTLGMELVGLSEVAEMLGVSIRMAVDLTRAEDFPGPVNVVHHDCQWDQDEVREWARDKGRLV